MTYEIELFHPSALPGAGAQVEALGPCKIVTKNVFVTVSEHSGEARLVLLEELSSLDRTRPSYTTTLGKTSYPRRVDLPARIVVETASGHARTISGDKIARLTLVKGTPPGRVTW